MDVFQLFTTVRKFNQIGVRPNGSRESMEEFFANPRSLITLCNALIMLRLGAKSTGKEEHVVFSGLLASCQLYTLGGKRLKPLKVWEGPRLPMNEWILGPVPVFSQRPLEGIGTSSVHVQHLSRCVQRLPGSHNGYYLCLWVQLQSSSVSIELFIVSKWGYILYIVGTPNLSSETIFCVLIDSYAVTQVFEMLSHFEIQLFISRAAISALAILFYQHCSVIRRSIKHLINEMVPEEQDECPLPESSLQKIHDSQISYQRIYNGKSVIEEYYSFVLFYSYGVCIPIFCILMFVVMSSQSVSIELALVSDNCFRIFRSAGRKLFPSSSGLSTLYSSFFCSAFRLLWSMKMYFQSWE